MTGPVWLEALVGLVVTLLAAWLTLMGALIIVRPKGPLLAEAVRLLPDVLRLVCSLAADRDVPTCVRVRLWLLLAYLALPIDVVPDFVPILGYADDAIVMTAVLRSVVHRAGFDTVRAHWPGTDDGFSVLARLTGLKAPTNSPPLEGDARE